MRPHKSPLFIATLAGTLLPLRAARAVVATTLMALAVLVSWMVTAAGVAIGIVTRTLPASQGAPAFATITSPLADRALLLPPGNPAALPSAGDLVIASGMPQTLDGVGAFLRTAHLTVLPLADLQSRITAALASAPVDQVNPATLVVIALLFAAFAPIVLRLVASAAMAGATGALAAGLWHLNQIHVVLPLPADLMTDVLMGCAIIGGVAGWKATGSDINRIGQRIGALIMLPFVLPSLEPLISPLPPTLLLGLLPLAVLRPTLILVAASLPLIDRALDPSPMVLVATAVILIGLRLWRDSADGLCLFTMDKAFGQPFQPRPDAKGSFNLAQILEPRQED